MASILKSHNSGLPNGQEQDEIRPAAIGCAQLKIQRKILFTTGSLNCLLLLYGCKWFCLFVIDNLYYLNIITKILCILGEN